MLGAASQPRHRRGDARVWDTRALPPHEQFCYWREIVCEAFLPLRARRPGEGPFMGSVQARRIGALTVARIASDPQTVARTPELIQRRASDMVYVNMQLRGTGGAEQDGRTALQRPGDCTIVDSERPFELRFGASFEQICLTLPGELLWERLAAPGACTALTVSGAGSLGGVLASRLRFLAQPRVAFDGEAARIVGDQLTEVLALALGRAASSTSSTQRALLLQAAVDEIERSLDDPELSPARVAARVNVSTRTLQRLFAQRGTTFGRWLLRRRLERCHRDLAEPALAHLTIADVAGRWGFVDRTHFARAFGDRYGATPREHRTLARSPMDPEPG